MTFGSFVGIALTLAIVLALLAITLRVLRRVAMGQGTRAGAMRLEVIQRLPLGPRQGIAVVRIGEQTVAVSVGEGGVRPLLVLEPEDVSPDAVSTPVVTRPTNGRDFTSFLRDGLRASGLSLGLALVLGTAAVSAVRAQGAPVPAAGTRPGANPPAAAPARGAATGAARTAAAATPAAAQRATVATPQGGGTVPPLTGSRSALNASQLDLKLTNGDKDNALHLSGTVGVVVMLGLLTLLPTLLLMMTSFTRILIVLHFLKQALGTQAAPPAQLVAALALLLTGFVMSPTLTEVNRTAITPWLDGRIEQAEMMKTAIQPFRVFMLRQTRERDIEAFLDMSRTEPPRQIEDTPTVVLMSAFVTSELRTSFQLGFAIFLPFIVIDLVVASVLMSMGMFMLPPAMISLPFKLLLFVLVDGWSLLIQSLVASFK